MAVGPELSGAADSVVVLVLLIGGFDSPLLALCVGLLLGVVYIRARPRDRLLELLERRRQVRARELLQRRGGVVFVRRPPLGAELLA